MLSCHHHHGRSRHRYSSGKPQFHHTHTHTHTRTLKRHLSGLFCTGGTQGQKSRNVTCPAPFRYLSGPFPFNLKMSLTSFSALDMFSAACRSRFHGLAFRVWGLGSFPSQGGYDVRERRGWLLHRSEGAVAMRTAKAATMAWCIAPDASILDSRQKAEAEASIGMAKEARRIEPGFEIVDEPGTCGRRGNGPGQCRRPSPRSLQGQHW